MTDTNSYYMKLEKPLHFPLLSPSENYKRQSLWCPQCANPFILSDYSIWYDVCGILASHACHREGTCQQQRRAAQIITLTDPQTQRLSFPPTVQVNTNKSEEAKAIMAGRDPGSLWPLLLFKPYRWHDVKNEPVSCRVPISEWAHYLPFFTLNLLPACSGRCYRGVTHFYGLLTAVVF